MLEIRKGVIISGFAGIGKTSLKDKVPALRNLNMYDLKSHTFKKDPGWEKIYVECANALADKYDYVFVSTHDSVIEELLRQKLNFYVIYPDASCKEDFKKRFMERGSSAQYINKFMGNWNTYVDHLETLNYQKKIRLHRGQYLSDVITRIRVVR